MEEKVLKKPKEKNVLKYYLHARTQDTQAVGSASKLGKILKKAKNWKEISEAEYKELRGIGTA